MATTEAALYSVARGGSAQPTPRAGAGISAVLTIVALAVHGYHPYAEDGGVYLAGVKRVLHPQLYPYWSDFVTTHLKFSLFAPMIACLVRFTHLQLMMVMLLVYAATIWLTLFAAWLLVSRCYRTRIECAGAVALLALALTIPVAGTSLMLMDPYVTARSVSTPCGILMLVAVLDIRAAWADRIVSWTSIALGAASFLLALTVHPLMAAYALACVLLLGCVSLSDRTARIAATAGTCLLGIALAACLEHLSPANMPGYADVARTRTYWFLSTWHWYELVGLAGPILVLLALAWRKAESLESANNRLAILSALAGASATIVALLFARISSPSYEVAKLQPLRIYQTIYLLMLLALGAAVSQRILKRSVPRWMLLFLLLGGGMAWVQRQTFPHSAHIEAPWAAPANPWKQAFEWARSHTPQDAMFALDANYISVPGEDSHNFRAIAERSALPDYSKDGGIASIAPALTSQWLAGETAQMNLDRQLGPGEIARLRARGVDWVVIARSTPTSLKCSYSNAAVRVCPLP